MRMQGESTNTITPKDRSLVHSRNTALQHPPKLTSTKKQVTQPTGHWTCGTTHYLTSPRARLVSSGDFPQQAPQEAGPDWREHLQG